MADEYIQVDIRKLLYQTEFRLGNKLIEVIYDKLSAAPENVKELGCYIRGLVEMYDIISYVSDVEVEYDLLRDLSRVYDSYLRQEITAKEALNLMQDIMHEYRLI